MEQRKRIMKTSHESVRSDHSKYELNYLHALICRRDRPNQANQLEIEQADSIKSSSSGYSRRDFRQIPSYFLPWLAELLRSTS